VLIHRVSVSENHAGSVQLQLVVLALRRAVDRALHFLLVFAAEHHNRKATLTLVRKRDLLHQCDALLAPAENERVVALNHLQAGPTPQFNLMTRKLAATHLRGPFLKIIDPCSDRVRNYSDHQCKDEHARHSRQKPDYSRAALRFSVGSWIVLMKEIICCQFLITKR
jgi:hypothetical protein